MTQTPPTEPTAFQGMNAMNKSWSTMLNRPFLILRPGHGQTADRAIDHARTIGAIYPENGPYDEKFIIEMDAGIGPELWTERALRRKLVYNATPTETPV